MAIDAAEQRRRDRGKPGGPVHDRGTYTEPAACESRALRWRCIPLKIAIGADHAGFTLKNHLGMLLEEWGHDVEDCGTHSEEPIDYPDVARVVAQRVADHRADSGVLVCGSGNGMAIAANKVSGVRAVTVHDETSARLAREHNDANVFCIGERLVGRDVAAAALAAWLATPFAGGRHARRVAKIEEGPS